MPVVLPPGAAALAPGGGVGEADSMQASVYPAPYLRQVAHQYSLPILYAYSRGCLVPHQTQATA